MCLKYEFPLSKVTGKIRIKERLAFSDYGIPVPPTRTIITHKHYIEWQIGYDKLVDGNEEYRFIGANGKRKQIYELSEFLEYVLKYKLIDCRALKVLKYEIQNNKDFIEYREKITRSNFTKEAMNNLTFFKIKCQLSTFSSSIFKQRPTLRNYHKRKTICSWHYANALFLRGIKQLKGFQESKFCWEMHTKQREWLFGDK
nr:hypothetical protein [Helicobacter equorum]